MRARRLLLARTAAACAVFLLIVATAVLIALTS
jgi:hypothetical protein